MLGFTAQLRKKSAKRGDVIVKIAKKLTAIAVSSLMMFSIAGMNVFAASTTQDGLEVTLITDKNDYSESDSITTILTVRNTNNNSVMNVSMGNDVPDGYILSDASENVKTLDKLEPKATVELKSTYIAEGTSKTGNDDEISDSQISQIVHEDSAIVQTDDHTFVIVVFGMLLIIGSVGIIIATLKSKNGRKFLSLLVAVSLVGSISTVAYVETNAVEAEHKNIVITESVKVSNKIRGLTGQVSYTVIPDKTVHEFTITFDSDGGSKVDSQKVAEGDYVKVPNSPTREGYVFLGWYTSKNFDKKFDFANTKISKDLTLYAKWEEISDGTSDKDSDGLPESVEIKLGTDPNSTDSDGDGLSDYFEAINIWTDPLNIDTDNNGINDGEEDFDNDGLNNLEEQKLKTNPYLEDTDKDGLSDFEEVKKYNTSPIHLDTDKDGVSDGKEIEIGTDPLVAEISFNVTANSTNEDTVSVSVETKLSGKQVETLKVERYQNEYYFPETMPGYIGGAYDFSVDGEIGSATISFNFDEALLDNENFDPVIYYFNEDKQLLEELETTITGNKASAIVTHFSKYILLNRKVYESSFEWQDVWDTSGYSGVEVVLVIDDSGSMWSNDRANNRLTVARNLIDKLPENSKAGIVRFSSSTSILTDTLTSDKETAKSFLNTNYFRSNGGTYMYSAIDKSFALFESSSDDILKMMVILSDGETDDTGTHETVIARANDNKVKLYTVGLGNSSSRYFTEYLKPLANNTAGTFYLAEDASKLQDIYDDINKKIDIETDSDNDGIADYYEDHMVMFNGLTVTLDKNNPDTDGDGLSDGEEVAELNYQYNADRTQVIVTGRLLSNPLEQDTDGDGLTDEEEINYYGTSPTDADTDGDGLNDYIEVTNWFDPFEKDIDGDGRLDLQEYQEGTSPFNYDKEWYEHIGDFVYGFVLGDFIEDTDSFAVIAGQITSGCVPYVGVVADARDVIGNLVHGDYLFAGLSFVGLVPAAGDIAKSSGKAVKFIGKNIDNVSKVAELIEFLEKNFPDVAKAMSKSDEFADAAKIIYSGDFLKLSKKEAEGIMKTFEKFGISFKAISKPSSKTLGENLVRAGKLRPSYPSAAHHIVAGSSRKAVEARAILYKFNVDINDAVNGVFLPTVKNISNAAYHPSLHTDSYYRKVTELLIQAKSKDDVIDILKDIAEQLEKGTF